MSRLVHVCPVLVRLSTTTYHHYQVTATTTVNPPEPGRDRLTQPVSPHVFPWTTSKSFQILPTIPPSHASSLFASSRQCSPHHRRSLHLRISMTCHQHCICTNPSLARPPPASKQASNQQSARPINHVVHAVLPVMLGDDCDYCDGPRSASATSRSRLLTSYSSPSKLHSPCILLHLS